jgi:hypothetical protein
LPISSVSKNARLRMARTLGDQFTVFSLFPLRWARWLSRLLI